MAELNQYEFVIEGKHICGRRFRKEFMVFAGDQDEALEELRVCLGCWELVVDWEIASLDGVEDVSSNERVRKRYSESGAFTVYVPEFNFLDQ